jgi:DNA-binding beta-propeller fold protein YncE
MTFRLAVALLLLSAPAWAAPTLKGPRAGGVFVLDDCDPEYQGKSAYADNLTYYDGSGKLVFRVTGLNTCEMIGSNRQIAYDAERKHVWVAESVAGHVRKLDLDGKELLVIKDVKPGAIAVDPGTGNLWVVRSTGVIYGDDTVVYDPAGKHVATHKVSGWDLAYDPKGKAFWFAAKDLVKVSAEGKELVRKTVAAWCSSALAVHPETGKVWVAVRDHPDVAGSKNQLLGFDNDGGLKHTIDFDQVDPFHLSLDRKSGAVWLTSYGKGVRRYSADGALELDRKMEALCAHADPATGELWVVTREETVRMTPTGEIKVRARHAGRTTQAWIAGP